MSDLRSSGGFTPRGSHRPVGLPAGTRWEVRIPLLYGSQHFGFYATENEALAVARTLVTTKYPGAVLNVRTESRTIYVQDSDD